MIPRPRVCFRRQLCSPLQRVCHQLLQCHSPLLSRQSRKQNSPKWGSTFPPPRPESQAAIMTVSHAALSEEGSTCSPARPSSIDVANSSVDSRSIPLEVHGIQAGDVAQQQMAHASPCDSAGDRMRPVAVLRIRMPNADTAIRLASAGSGIADRAGVTLTAEVSSELQLLVKGSPRCPTPLTCYLVQQRLWLDGCGRSSLCVAH